MPQDWNPDTFRRTRKSVPRNNRASPRVLTLAVIVAAVTAAAALRSLGLF